MLPMSNEVHESWRDAGVRSDGTEPLARVTSDGVVHLDVSWLVPADLRAVDALARLQVAASRGGRRLRLHGADGGLAELLEFVGLSDVVRLCPCCRSSGQRGEPTPCEA
jgi:ABC-type transporter Mla MlaB component